ncbi:MAG: hypothetical protein QG628_298 [Patescibacteria group bacterium]|jgi:uncharacterized membrane protein|nr:hypothetical protein [Patescibacteria group bacterium]
MKINYPALYVITLSAFLVLDGLWLGLIAKNLYATQLKEIMTDNIKWGAAVIFYLLFIGMLMYFVIVPALQGGSMQIAATRGALFGLATYATYDLTNYATLKGFPLNVVIIDMIWGTVLSAGVASIAYLAYSKFVQ